MTPEIPTVREARAPLEDVRFTQRLSSTPRGARLARLLTVRRLLDWGQAADSACVLDASLVVAELAANAVTHGRVRGRDFLLTLVLSDAADTGSASLRVEVADCRGERAPVRPVALPPLDTRGRGLLLVESVATRWGVAPRLPSGKVVWAELTLADHPAPRDAPTPRPSGRVHS